MPLPRDVVAPVLAGAGLALVLRAARAVSEHGRSVRAVTDLRDAPPLLFEFEQGAVEVHAAPQPRSTWTPPSNEPIIDSMPVPLPAGSADEDDTEKPPTTRRRVRTRIRSGSAPSTGQRAQGATRGPAVLGAVLEAEFAGDRGLLSDADAADGRAAQEAEPLPRWARALGVFDLETTGIDTGTARIVTAHVGLIDETGAVVERKDWIVDPGVPIPDGAAAVHGITDARAQRFGRRPGEVVAEILAAIRSVFDRGFPLVVYNAPYDLTLLGAEARRHRLWPLETTAPIVDPFVLDKQVDRFRRGKRTLTRAAEVYGVHLADAHDAGADAIAAGRVAQAIARRHADELSLTAQELHDAQVGWCADQADGFQAYMREQRDPEFTTSGAWPSR